MKTSVKFGVKSRGGHERWRGATRRLLQKRTTTTMIWCKTKLTIFCLFTALTAGAQSRTQNLPVTDAEKISDALRAAPSS
jgi:hypothetical protein